MGTPTVRTFEEIAEILRTAPPPTPDDVTVLKDGRRIDSAEKARAWAAELIAEREAELAHAARESTT